LGSTPIRCAEAIYSAWLSQALVGKRSCRACLAEGLRCSAGAPLFGIDAWGGPHLLVTSCNLSQSGATLISSRGIVARGAFASLSNGLAVLTRQRETLIGAVSAVILPLTFLASALMQQSLVPGWIRSVAKFNPVNWAVEAGRSAAMQRIDWGLVGSRFALLAALAVLCAVFATRAFARYQRSL